MIKIKPFKALRPKKDLYSKVIAPPYDVVSHEDCMNLVKGNPYSLIHISRSEVDLPSNVDHYSSEVYLKAKENLEKFIRDGFLVYDDKEYFYIYRLIMGTQKQIGFVAGVNAYDYIDGIVKKHENTRQDKEDDRIRHIDITNTQLEPVFLAYRSKESLDKILFDIEKTTPEIDLTTDDGVKHTLWIVKDRNIHDKILSEFKNIPALYVADGHHRTAAACSISKKRDADNKSGTEKEYQYFLSVIFPDNMLKIMDYNRVIKDLNSNSLESFISKVEKNFMIEKTKSNDGKYGYKPTAKNHFGMYLNGEWYLLKAKEHIKSNDPVKTLDVSILQEYILSPILGIENPRTDKRIDFIGGIKGTDILKELVDKKEFAVSFSMYPTSMAELFAVADANKLMPPKSTWFEPKLKSGMVIHTL
ncbi:MAG TPA: DUF1015 family protein [Spirochaetota bacterium]|nr:DUF1015 family protein [Spirochaetota bacterium]